MIKRLIPTLFTAGNAGCGIGAMFLVLQGGTFWPGFLLLVAAFLDGIDGTVARKLGVAGRAGAGFDTIADMVSFGAAPAVLVAVASPTKVGLAAGLFYGIMILARLVRYHMIAMPKGIFLGLPAPIAAMPVMAVAMMTLQADGNPVWPIVAAGLAGLLAILPIVFPAWHHPSIRTLPLAVKLFFLVGGIGAMAFVFEESVLASHLLYIVFSSMVLTRYDILHEEEAEENEQKAQL